jgi:hypothetical protein
MQRLLSSSEIPLVHIDQSLGHLHLLQHSVYLIAGHPDI